jgi:hypothetical protein
MTDVNRDLVEQVFRGAPFIGALGVKLVSPLVTRRMV